MNWRQHLNQNEHDHHIILRRHLQLINTNNNTFNSLIFDNSIIQLCNYVRINADSDSWLHLLIFQ